MKVNSHKLDRSLYPEQIRQLSPSLAQLFYAGVNIEDWNNKPKLAVVGSRKISHYGQNTTETLVKSLASKGVVIISGLAYGVDAVAHRTALSAGGVTIAVLPTSIDKIYPSSHQNLAQQILDRGGIFSEYSRDDPIYKSNFTDRNRIIAGLADAILITEAAVNSGSLSTARYALNQGKTVMVVPGNITSPTSAGCNNLIKSGAVPITEVSDIFFALGIKESSRDAPPFRGSELEAKVYKLITGGTFDQELLALKSNIDGAGMGSVLTSLEINGYIKPLGAGKWTASY
jgi:DNA processing protein